MYIRWVLVHFSYLIKMDNTVENGYKCVLCHRRLASKYSLERHIRLKHKSNKSEVVEYSNPPNIDVDIVKKGIDIDSDSEQESDTELGHKNNNVIYANKAGWVETDNKEEIDNSESEESSMETDNKDIDNNENMETDNKKDIDNGGSEESVMDSEEVDDVASIEELDYKHDLFDVVDTRKEISERFNKYCGVVVTFRIKPPPVHISRPRMYRKWMDDLFNGILEYLNPKYPPEPEDCVCFYFFHADTNTTQWMRPRKRKDINAGDIVSELLRGRIANPSGYLTIALHFLKAKITCPTCGHTRVNKDGMSYTD